MRIALAVVVATALSCCAFNSSYAASSNDQNAVAEHQLVGIRLMPVRAYQLGDRLVSGNAVTVVNPNANGCQRIPASGYLTQNSTSSTTAEYSNYWNWSAGSASSPFSWWLKKTDGTTVASDTSSSGDNRSLGANNYYWEVENKSPTPQAWTVCYDVQ